MYTKAYFFTDGDDNMFHGFTDGKTWNGWECPVFDMDTIKQIQKHVNNGTDYNPLLIDGDKVYVVDCGYDEKSECEKVSIDGVDYYSIDGWTWCSCQHDTYQIKYRFKDKKGKTRKTMTVTYNQYHHCIDISGTASELQAYAAIDGGAHSVGALTIESEYVEQGANGE